MLEYGFDSQGGFYVIDHQKRAAGYAYPSSQHNARAKRCPKLVAGIIAEQFDRQHKLASAAIIEEHYLHVCNTK